MKNRKEFLSNIMNEFIHRINKANEEITEMYQGYRTLLINQLDKNPELAEELKVRLEILDKIYKLFSDDEIRVIISKNKLSTENIIERLQEKLLGDEKRKYEMSDMFNESLISYVKSSQDGEEKRLVKYVHNEGVEHEYFDMQGKSIKIQSIGELHYKSGFGVTKTISKYRISKQGADNITISEVFSIIRISKMSEEQYRDAVLYELLSENNMTLSNAQGYIGTILEETDLQMNPGEEKSDSFDYRYKINDRYSISYDAEDLTAVVIYQQKNKSENKDTKNTPMPHESEERKVNVVKTRIYEGKNL